MRHEVQHPVACALVAEFKKFHHLFKKVIPAVDMRKAKKSSVSQKISVSQKSSVKVNNENPSSATATDAEDAESSHGALVIEVSLIFSLDKVNKL